MGATIFFSGRKTILTGLEWPRQNQRPGLTSERYLVLPTNVHCTGHGAYTAGLCSFLVEVVEAETRTLCLLACARVRAAVVHLFLCNVSGVANGKGQAQMLQYDIRYHL